MPILADQHMHSSFSADSKAPLRDMVESAISKGLTHINITEHNDFDSPASEMFPEGAWDLNVDSYLYELLRLREEFKDKITIGFGIELGLQECCFRKNAVLSRSHEFDFVIGSIHMVGGVDTYDPKFFEGRSVKEAVTEYYETMLRNLKQFTNYDVLGHMDYISRTVPGGESAYNSMDYKNFTDEVINILLENEKGIEINTSAVYKRGMSQPNPCYDIVKAYKEKGGEIITVGSDAHKPENIAGAFDVAEKILADCGFKYYSVFKDRIPTYVKL
ncbi:MAG: histidinol-phosphatase HisJ family protein [Lachnospiraceae bacterium]|nr:histidinol-phosphatase HisJ family protein [Lachnospiraceae bacterium]